MSAAPGAQTKKNPSYQGLLRTKNSGENFSNNIEPYPGEGGLTSENKLQLTIIIQEIRIGFRIFDI